MDLEVNVADSPVIPVGKYRYEFDLTLGNGHLLAAPVEAVVGVVVIELENATGKVLRVEFHGWLFFLREKVSTIYNMSLLMKKGRKLLMFVSTKQAPLKNFLLSFVWIITQPIFAQSTNPVIAVPDAPWERLDLPHGSLHTIKERNGRLWGIDGSLYFSDDQGENWTQHPDFLDKSITGLMVGDFGIVVLYIHQDYYSTTSSGWYSSQEIEWWYSSDGTHFAKQTDEYFGCVQGSSYGQYYDGCTRYGRLSDSAFYKFASGVSTDLLISQDAGATWTVGADRTGFNHFLLQNDTALFYHAADTSTVMPLRVLTSNLTNSTDYTIPIDSVPGAVMLQEGRLRLLYSDHLRFTDDFGTTWTTQTLDFPADLNLSHFTLEHDGLHQRTNYPLEDQWFAPWSTLEFFLLPAMIPTLEGDTSHHVALNYFRSGDDEYLLGNTAIWRKLSGEMVFTPKGRGIAPPIASGYSIYGRLRVELTRNGSSVWYESLDSGSTWAEIPPHPLGHLRVLFYRDQEALVQTDSGLHRFGGDVDTHVPFSIPGIGASSLRVVHSGNRIYFDQGEAGGPLYRLEEDFTLTLLGLPPVEGRVAPGDSLLYFFSADSVYRSFDDGENWQSSPTTSVQAGTIEKTPYALLAYEHNGAPVIWTRISHDHGQTWAHTGTFFNTSIAYPTFSWAPARRMPAWGAKRLVLGGGISLSNNYGHDYIRPEGSFGEYHAGLSWGTTWWNIFSPTPKDAFFHNNYLIALTSRMGLHRLNLDEFLVNYPAAGTTYGTLTGRVYQNQNGNCAYDDGVDYPMMGRTLQFGDRFAVTDSSGHFDLLLPQGEYDYAVSTNDYYGPACQTVLSGSVTVDSLQTDTLDLVLDPLLEVVDLGVTLYTADVFRPGRLSRVQLQIRNHGTLPVVDAPVTLSYQTTLQTVEASSGGQETSPGVWTFTNSLDPGTTAQHFLELRTDTFATMGHPVYHFAESSWTNDPELENDTMRLHDVVIASYDPNDKTAFPATDLLPLTEHELQYRIRFQNLGTDTAFRVVIRDTLLDVFDPASFEMIDASHDYELHYGPDRVLVWDFKDIDLPHAAVDEAGSNGFILFKIRTRDDLPHQDSVRNRASIYFDFNPPVHTNTTDNRVQRGYIQIADTVQVCAGDTFADQTWWVDGSIGILGSGLVADTLTLTQVLVQPTYDLTFDTTHVSGELMFGIPVYGDTTFVFLLNSVEGCDSMVTYHTQMLTTTRMVDTPAFQAQIHPNPTRGTARLRVGSPGSEAFSITLHSADGRVVAPPHFPSRVVGGVPTSLPADGLLPGVYWLILRNNDQQHMLRWVVQGED